MKKKKKKVQKGEVEGVMDRSRTQRVPVRNAKHYERLVATITLHCHDFTLLSIIMQYDFYDFD